MSSQTLLFEQIKFMIPEEHKLVNVISDLLKVKSDSAYRRIRGETELTFSELETICAEYNLSMDEFLHIKTRQNLTFQYDSISDQSSYTESVLQLSKKFHAVSLASEKELLMTAQDIPFYHFCKYPELAVFRIYAWHSTRVCGVDSFSKFCDNTDNSEIVSIYENLYNAYMQIPSKELWSKQTVDTTLSLLEYYYEAGAFKDRNTVIHLLDQLAELLHRVQQYANNGYKEDSNKTQFSLYACSVNLENSFMMLREGEGWLCCMKLFAVNRMITRNELISSETYQWINDMISKSIQISGNTAVKERYLFFEPMKKRVQNLIDKINAG